MSKPIKCTRCGRENDLSFTFCLDCGQSLKTAVPAPGERLCPACGSKVLPTFRFCGHCGRPVDPAPGKVDSPPIAGPTKPVAPTPERSKEYRLTVIRRDGQPGPSMALDKPEIVCGRTEGDLVFKDDLSVSPRHAQFSLQQGAISVTDLGSLNGTFVRLRTSRSLALGDEIRLGHQLLRLDPLPRSADHPADSLDGPLPWGSPDAGYRLRLAQLLEGGGLGEIFPLKSGENTIGREAGNIHFSYDRFVSGRHARIEISENAVTLTDLGSSNGTFVRINGPTALSPGDQLLVGIQLLRLE